MRKIRLRCIVRLMEQNSQNSSTYSALFAVLLIVFIVGIIAYNAVKKIAADQKRVQEEQAKKDIVVQGLPNGDGILPGDVVLYDNLTDEEAARIIDELLKSGEKNIEKLKKLETEILEE